MAKIVKLKPNHKTGEFGTIYTEFKNLPKEAILHLMNTHEGECVNAFYREDLGFVDIVWGKKGTKEKGYTDGYGLAHIIQNHQAEIRQLGFELYDFIPLIFAFGVLSKSNNETRLYLEGESFRLVITTQWFKKPKKMIMTAFDLRPVSRKNPQRARQLEKNNS